MVSLFVWYRVVRDDPETEALVRGMLARLACRTGVAGRLMKKSDAPEVWMEIHARVGDPGRYQRAMRQALDIYDLDLFIDGARHIENFREAARPARGCATDHLPA